MSQSNPYRIAKWQHIIPKTIIENFVAKNGHATCVNVSTKKIARKSPKSKDFCVNQLWDEGSEKGWMKQIEDSFSDTCKRMVKGRELSTADNHRVTEFYLLMYFRSITQSAPLKEASMGAENLTRWKSGESINTPMIATAIVCGIPNREVILNLFGFEPSDKRYGDKRFNNDRANGNQNLNVSTFLTTPPTNKHHAEYLESNVPWKLGTENISVDAKSRNEREAVYFFDENGMLSSKTVNGLKMQMEIAEISDRLNELNWGYMTANCGEFLLPRGLPIMGIVPFSPKAAFVANHDSSNLTCLDVHELNRAMLENSAEIICKNENQIMLDAPLCNYS